MGTLAVQLGVPVIMVSKGLSPSSHFPVGFRLPVDSASHGAARHAWRLADAILDRLVHNAYKINLKGESMRKNNPDLTTDTTNK